MEVSARFDEREYGAQAFELLSPTRVAFDRTWSLLKRALRLYGPTHRKSDVWQRIDDRDCQLWTTENSAVVTSIETWPTGFKELNFWLASGDLDEINGIRPTIETWAAKMGCHRACISGRAGWSRALPGYRTVATAIVKDL